MPGKRIIQFVQTFSAFDGIGKIILQNARLFEKLGYRHLIVAEDIKVKVKESSTMNWGRFRQLARKDDVFLCHYGAYSPILDEIKEMPQIKVLYYHNITPAFYFRGWDNDAALSCDRGTQQLTQLSTAFDFFVTPSQFNGRQLGEIDPLISDLVFVIPPYVQVDRLRKTGEEHTGLGIEELRLAYVGRWVPHKRVDLLFRLIAYLNLVCGQPSILTMVGHRGDGKYAIAVEDLSRRIDANRFVTFLGAVPEDTMEKLYRGLSAYVSFSEHEGFGLPILEAMAAGTPVVAANTGAIPEVLGGSGLLFESNQIDKVAEALMILSRKNDIRESLIRGQWDRVESEYCEARALENWNAFLNRGGW